MSFKDKVVLVTGAGKGTGRAVAEAFAAQGALVAANDITPINLDQTMQQITDAGGVAKDYITDIAKKMPVQAMVEQVLGEWERIDILINNAGVEPHAPLLDLDAWDWQRTIDVNLSGPFYTTQAVGRVMREQGGGAIVNIAGRGHGQKERAAYVASKLGLIGLTREAARELAEYNIRVNAVCPGVIETETSGQNEEMGTRWRADIPLSRLGQPQDVVGLIMFLCSNEASDITGQVINVDGGQVMS